MAGYQLVTALLAGMLQSCTILGQDHSLIPLSLHCLSHIILFSLQHQLLRNRGSILSDVSTYPHTALCTVSLELEVLSFSRFGIGLLSLIIHTHSLLFVSNIFLHLYLPQYRCFKLSCFPSMTKNVYKKEKELKLDLIMMTGDRQTVDNNTFRHKIVRCQID